MKIREYAKAIAALLGAVATFLVSVNAPAEWSVWIGGIVAILTGVATFGIPNKMPAAPDAPVIGLIEGLQKAGNEAQAQADAAQARAVGGITDLLNMAAGGITGVIAASPNVPGPVDDLIRAVAALQSKK